MASFIESNLSLSQGIGQKEPTPNLFDKTYTSKASYEFDPNDDVWSLSKDKPLRFKSLKEVSSVETVYWVKTALLSYTAEYSPDYLHNIIANLVGLHKVIGAVEITDVALRNYRATLGKRDEHKLGTIVAFLKQWEKKGYPGVTAGAIEYLSTQTLKGNPKGEAVQLLDPVEGAFSAIEEQAIHEASMSAYHNGTLSTEDFAAALLLLGLGGRIVQLAKTKVKDLVKGTRNNDEEAFFIKMPRAKNGLGWRDESKLKPLNKVIWQVLSLHAQDVVKSVESSFPLIDKSLLPELPLFPDWDFLDGLNTEAELVEVLHPDIDVLHRCKRKFADDLMAAIKGLNIISERTGEPLHINARRFRYRKGTVMAQENMSKMAIAEGLDQSDDQNAGVYTQNHAQFSEVVSEAVDLLLMPLAQAFRGKIVHSEKSAVNGDNRSKRIRFTDGDTNVNLATCGEEGGCTLRAPIACYTCSLFQPWADAPHHAVLDFCLNERDEEWEITKDRRVTEVLDRTILAIRQVIVDCEIKNKDKRNKLENIRMVK